MSYFPKSLRICALCMLFTAGPAFATTPYSFSDVQYPGSTANVATGINDSGTIIGYYIPSSGNGLWHGFQLSNGDYTAIDFPGAATTFPFAINSQGDVVGVYGLANGGYGDQHPFLLTGGSYYALPDVPGDLPWNTVAEGISDSGEIAGTYVDTCFCKTHGFIYSGGTSGTYLTTDDPGFVSTNLYNVTDSGTIAGAGWTSGFGGGGIPNGFLLDSSGVFTPVLVPGAYSDWATGVNSAGQVVGPFYATSSSPGVLGFLDTGGQFTTIDPFNSTNTEPDGINSKGAIVGMYQSADGVIHGYLATPEFNICLLYDTTKSVKSGATIPIKLELCDSNDVDQSSASVTLHAVSLTQLSTAASLDVEDPGNADPDNDFRFDSSLGTNGGYQFNLKTSGLSTGSYQLNFTAGSDPYQYAAPFQVR